VANREEKIALRAARKRRATGVARSQQRRSDFGHTHLVILSVAKDLALLADSVVVLLGPSLRSGRQGLFGTGKDHGRAQRSLRFSLAASRKENITL
jgi:hypothetical protein